LQQHLGEAEVRDSVKEQVNVQPLAVSVSQSMLFNAAGFINRDAVLSDIKAGPVLLALRPASGKTHLIMNMLHPSRLLMIMVPTQALQQQVCARHECSVRGINVSTRS
jgi:hypothetical protein